MLYSLLISCSSHKEIENCLGFKRECTSMNTYAETLSLAALVSESAPVHGLDSASLWIKALARWMHVSVMVLWFPTLLYLYEGK